MWLGQIADVGQQVRPVLNHGKACNSILDCLLKLILVHGSVIRDCVIDYGPIDLCWMLQHPAKKAEGRFIRKGAIANCLVSGVSMIQGLAKQASHAVCNVDIIVVAVVVLVSIPVHLLLYEEVQQCDAQKFGTFKCHSLLAIGCCCLLLLVCCAAVALHRIDCKKLMHFAMFTLIIV